MPDLSSCGRAVQDDKQGDFEGPGTDLMHSHRWRITQRAIFCWRAEHMDDYSFNERMTSIRNSPLWQTAPVGEDFRAVQDEMRYLLLRHIEGLDRKALLRAKMSCSEAFAAIPDANIQTPDQQRVNQARQNRLLDENAILEASLEHATLQHRGKQMSTTALRMHVQDLHQKQDREEERIAESMPELTDLRANVKPAYLDGLRTFCEDPQEPYTWEGVLPRYTCEQTKDNYAFYQGYSYHSSLLKMPAEEREAFVAKIGKAWEQWARGALAELSLWPWHVLKFTAAAIAVQKCELRADMFELEAASAGSLVPGPSILMDLMRGKQKRLAHKDVTSRLASLWEEFFLCRNLLDRRDIMKHLRCSECGEHKAEDDYRRLSDGRLAKTQRCRTCEFPCCEACGRQRKESEGQVPISQKEADSTGSKNEGGWFCDQAQCKTKKPRKCSACKRTKPGQEFASGRGHHHSRCLSCEYPACATCGFTRPRENKAVEERHKDKTGKWYCQPQCRPKSR